MSGDKPSSYRKLQEEPPWERSKVDLLDKHQGGRAACVVGEAVGEVVSWTGDGLGEMGHRCTRKQNFFLGFRRASGTNTIYKMNKVLLPSTGHSISCHKLQWKRVWKIKNKKSIWNTSSLRNVTPISTSLCNFVLGTSLSSWVLLTVVTTGL